MKKIAVIIAGFIFLVSCGSSEVVREARKTINGDWILSSISYPDATAEVSVNLLEDASAECFMYSEWNFISNNNTGSYIITDSQCDSNTRFFNWSVDQASGGNENYDLLLKPTDSDHKSTTGNQGFRINLVTLTQTEMVWEQKVTFEGEPFTIRMNFNKK